MKKSAAAFLFVVWAAGCRDGSGTDATGPVYVPPAVGGPGAPPAPA
jgi:hypothetical protein